MYATDSDSIVGYLLVRGLPLSCIQWRHYSVDVWGHNSVDTDSWRRLQRIAGKTIGYVTKKWLVKSLKKLRFEEPRWGTQFLIVPLKSFVDKLPKAPRRKM